MRRVKASQDGIKMVGSYGFDPFINGSKAEMVHKEKRTAEKAHE